MGCSSPFVIPFLSLKINTFKFFSHLAISKKFGTEIKLTKSMLYNYSQDLLQLPPIPHSDKSSSSGLSCLILIKSKMCHLSILNI